MGVSEKLARVLSTAFVPGAQFSALVLEVRTVGELFVSSGQIVACDPLVCPETKPFTRTVPIGSHPVTVSIARFPDGDERIGCAMLKWNDSPVTDWEPALLPGQDPTKLKTDEFFAYPVDAGLGCFMDQDAAMLLIRRMDELRDKDSDSNYFDDVLEAELNVNYKHTRDWTNHHPVPDRPHNVIIFSSGDGDGRYPSFFGMASGAATCLVTDFCILPG